MTFKKTKINKFGLGLGLRSELLSSTLSFCQENPENDLIQWLEFIPENYATKGGKHRKSFRQAVDAGFQLIPHSVSISIGTAPKEKGEIVFNKYLLDSLKDIFTEVKPPWFSDHLSFSYIDGIYLEDLIPLPRTQEAIDVVADNVKYLQDEFQLPFLVENPSYYSNIILSEMKEYEFLNSIVNKADCGLLLDVNNIYVNSVNHEYDAFNFLDNMDLDRVVQVHVAGHDADYKTPSGEFLKVLDTHGQKTLPVVMELLDRLLEKTEVNGILLERDGNYPEDFKEITDELKEIRAVMNKHEKVLEVV